MAYVLSAPANDSTHHPAYRYLSVQVLHFNLTSPYGVEAEVQDLDTGKIYTLFSRKVVGSFLGLNVYELDLQMLLQDILGYNLNPYGGGNQYVDGNCMKHLAIKVYDYYLDSNGIVQKDTHVAGLAPDFYVTNSALQHTEWHNNPALRHFTMNNYLYTKTGTNFRFLTTRPDNSRVCIGDSEYLSMIIDTPGINAVTVVTYNSAGAINGAGTYYFTGPDATSSNYLNKGRRSIGVGPANINNTIFPYTSISTPTINSNTHHYEVYVGFFLIFLGIPIFVPVKKRTYYLDCPCCKTRDRLYFINALGAIDSIYFNEVKEGGGTVKSTSFQANLPIPHRVSEVGHARIDTQATGFLKYQRIFEQNELEYAFEFLRSVRIWRHNGGSEYVPMKMKDDSMKISQAEQNYELEFELEFANEYMNPRA